MSATMTVRWRSREKATAGGCSLAAIGRWRAHDANRSAAPKLARRLARHAGLRLVARRAPGIGPVWALLRRLAELGAPPRGQAHGQSAAFSGAAAKTPCGAARPRTAGSAGPTLEGSVGKLGRWAVLQGSACARRDRLLRPHRDGARRGVFPAARVADLVAGAAYLRNRHHRHSDRRADRISDQRDRGLSRRAAAVAFRRRYFRGGSGDHFACCARWACC